MSAVTGTHGAPTKPETGEPVVARTRAELGEALRSGKGTARTHGVTLVPTMGALHEGHASLIRQARRRSQGGPVVVSVFVNPLQFAPDEDLDRYPRTFAEDVALCADLGVDAVFAPAVNEVYPGGDPLVTVDPGPLGAELEGASRPGHFRGVLTVVAKLFGLVRPEAAVFGEKDYQQLTLIRRMAADLCQDVEVLGAPTVREADGLALSSRNRYLEPEDRRRATALFRALGAAQAAAAGGPGTAYAAAAAVLRGADGVELDYLALTDPGLGEPPETGEARLLVAARVGGTRLIDNVALTLGASDTTTQAGEPPVDSTSGGTP